MLLGYLLRHLVRRGTLVVIDHRGSVHRFSGEPGPTMTMRLHDPTLEWRLFFRPRLALGEGFMDGTLTIEDASIYDFLHFMVSNINAAPKGALTPFYGGFGKGLRALRQYNPLPRARRNVAHHYDLSDTLYELFLDADRQYSCAYFTDPEQTIEQAQADKKRHIASKLLLSPGQQVLDIGCGWGGLALYLAKECGVSVTGLTLSTEQRRVAERRAAAAGLADRVRFELCDYREVTGRFDRIVSVGMFEHVGVGHYPTFFRRITELLTDDGVALLHSIGRSDGPGNTNPWIRKYIFPGGYAPALSEVVPVIERLGLWVTDIEILRLHYAETLRAWRTRFNANRERIRALYDERFCRMWEFYLAGSEITFRLYGHMNFQIQLAKTVDAVPCVRDYMVDWERRHRAPAPERAARWQIEPGKARPRGRTLPCPGDEGFRRCFIDGLSQEPKMLPCKYFYDATGSDLFDRICELPEYYQTRTELKLLKDHAGEIASLIGSNAELIEFGAGALRKVRVLIESLDGIHAYVPVDISGEYLKAVAATLERDYPALLVEPVVGDFTNPVELPLSGSRRIGFFPGSTIGNFRRQEALTLLSSWSEMLTGGGLLIGVDLVKDPAVLHAAYNDAAGVTAAFNKNLLARANRELDANFNLDAFAHYACYNPIARRIEMYLISLKRQRARAAGRTFAFEEGEAIHTEDSHKYTVRQFRALAVEAGFVPRAVWVDHGALFSLHWLEAPA